MLKKILSKGDRVATAYLKNRGRSVDSSAFLLEAGQGKNINGNMFALARELCTNARWKGHKIYWVTVEDTLSSAKSRFAAYGYEVEFVDRCSIRYGELLASAKYLVTDNSFPPFFSKREEQVYLNTWHGTPLKTLGKSDIKNATSLANIQKNYLMADYALFPNELTRQVFMKDYMLEYVFQGNLLMCDYPRNCALFDDRIQKEIRKTLKLQGKQLIAYMPTWRGSNRTADAQIQKEILCRYFDEIDRQLTDDQIFYVNLHFLVGNIIDYSHYQHIRPFPAAYETYDFLGVCDLLVTDYSSVFFDYARPDRRIILFAYDLEEYMRERGTYFSIYDLPFPIVKTTKELVDEINHPSDADMQAFLDTYCAYRDPNTPEMIIDLLVNQEPGSLCIEQNPMKDESLVLLYAGDLKSKYGNAYVSDCIRKCAETYKDKHLLVCFRGKINEMKIEFFDTLPEGVEYMALVTKFNFTKGQKVLNFLSLRTRLFHRLSKLRLRDVYREERERLFPGINPAIFINLCNKPHHMQSIVSTFASQKILYHLPLHLLGLTAGSKKYSILLSDDAQYEEIVDQRNDDVRGYWKGEEEIYYNNQFQMANICHHFKNTDTFLRVRGFAVLRSNFPFACSEVHAEVSGHTYPCRMKKILRLSRGTRLVTYRIEIPVADINSFEIQNKVDFVYRDKDGYGFQKGVKYSLLHWRKGKNKQGPIRIIESEDTSAYFRQSINNVLYFTVRKRNLTDGRKEQIKLNLAYWLAKFTPSRDIVLLYEKEASRYEESASVVYEKLIDMGYDNVYFVLDRHYPHLSQIQSKYRQKLVYKGTFRHYYYFFQSRTFLGSEALVHVIDLRISNKHALDKIKAKDINYVFLQHGVMYMVSLDSESRKFFKPMKTDGKYRVVTSSKAEAKHFIELGGYDPEYIYVCGLPKFDRNTWNSDADKIVIMPTWRPWEYNEARYDFKDTKYYKMICRIFSAIPKDLQEKVIILPHPLFYDAVKESEFELKRYLNVDRKYDDVLKETKILITDYSSIAYDAFYRGCNVIFYWEEKDECMENYGPSTKLMLNEENAYGDICYNSEELKAVLEKNYVHEQPAAYREKYGKLVDYHDGKNTERLIGMLQKDGILK